MPTISQLPVASVVNPGDLFVIVQSAVTKQATDSLVIAAIQSTIQITESQVTNLTADLAARVQTALVTAGPGISIFSSGPGAIQISGTASPTGWTDVTATTQSMVPDNGYTANNAGLVTFTLPATAAYGTTLNVIGKGAGGWLINLNSGQSIHVGSSVTTVTTGSVASTNQFDAISLLCTVANTVWTAMVAPQGNLTIV